MLINIDFRWLKQGIKNRNSVLNRVGKSAIFVLTGSGYEGLRRTSPPRDISSIPPPGYTKRYVYASHADVLSGSLRVPTPRGAGTRDETVGGYNRCNYNPNQVNWLHLTWMPLSQSNYTRTKSYAGLATIAYVAAGTYMITRYIAD